MCTLKHLVIHVLHSRFSFRYLEEISEFIMRLCVRVEVHLCILLQLFVSLMFFLSPCEFTLRKLLIYLLKECWLSRFNFILMRAHLPLKLLLSLFSFGLFLLKDVKKSETIRVISLSSMFHFFCLSLLS